MEQENFRQLREKYTNRTATQSERIEYYKLILSGKYEEEDFNCVREALDENYEPTAHERRLLDHVRATIPMHQSKRRFFNYSKQRGGIWAAAAGLAACLVIAFVYLEKEDQVSISKSIAVTPDQTIQTLTFTGPDFIRLPDSSTVLLTANSSITYQSSYGNIAREIRLEGEAFFDVMHNPSREFRVLTNGVTTTVLGTAFNINTNKKNKVEVTVARGKVKVASEDRVFGIITPNEQIAVNTVDQSYEKRSVMTAKVTDWKDNYIILDNTTLEEAADILSKRYKVSIVFDGEAMKQCRVSTEFFTETKLEVVLDAITRIAHGSFKVDQSGRILLEGQGCLSESR